MDWLKKKSQAAKSKISTAAKSTARSMKRTVGGGKKSDDPEGERLLALFKAHKHDAKKMAWAAREAHQAAKAHLAAEAKMLAVVSALEADVGDAEADRKAYAEETAALQVTMGELQERYAALVLGPCQALYEGQVESVRRAYNAYEDVHARFDVLTAKAQKDPSFAGQLGEITNRFNEAKKTFGDEVRALAYAKGQVFASIKKFMAARRELLSDNAFRSNYQIRADGNAVGGGAIPADFKMGDAPVVANAAAGGGGGVNDPNVAFVDSSDDEAEGPGGPNPQAAAAAAAAAAAGGPGAAAPPAAGGDAAVTALYDYDATNEMEISFQAGDKIFVDIRHDSGWWEGHTADGKKGLFPSNFVE